MTDYLRDPNGLNSTTDDDLPGMWSQSDFMGGDPDERSYAQRERDARDPGTDWGIPDLRPYMEAAQADIKALAAVVVTAGLPPACPGACLHSEAVGAPQGSSCGGIYCDHWLPRDTAIVDSFEPLGYSEAKFLSMEPEDDDVIVAWGNPEPITIEFRLEADQYLDAIKLLCGIDPRPALCEQVIPAKGTE